MKKPKHRWLMTSITLAFVGFNSLAYSADNAEKVKTLTATCVACHGEQGLSVSPAFPNLAGQYQDYTIQALKAYRAGDRQNPIMAPMAANLSDQDIEDLAAYYASQSGLFVVKTPATR